MRIREGEVHIWLASTDVPRSELDLLARCLTEAERQRARRFRFDADRRRSIVSRGALRLLLGRYSGTEPNALTLVTASHGKPALANGALEFNVSHSGEHVAIALTVGSPVGVDIERVRPVSDSIAIAQRFFSPEESARVTAAADPDKEFFLVWTAKEAVVKAVGKGLGAGLATFTVPEGMKTFTPISSTMSATDLQDWSVRQIESPAGYCAAVALRGTTWRVNLRQFVA